MHWQLPQRVAHGRGDRLTRDVPAGVGAEAA